MKNRNIVKLMVALVVVGTVMTSAQIDRTWSYQADRNGDGVITAEEENESAKDMGFSSLEDLMNHLEDPAWVAQYNAAHPAEINGGSTSTTPKETTKTEHTHSYKAEVTKDTSCTEEGELTYTCSCGDTYTEPIALVEHKWETSTTKEPTCTEKGEATKKCSVCGTEEVSEIPAKGHTPGEWKEEKKATCLEEGRTVQYCTDCKSPVKTMMIEKLDHQEGEWEVTKNPTMISKGTKTLYCTVGGEVLAEEEIPANTWQLVVVIVAILAVLIGGIVVIKKRS